MSNICYCFLFNCATVAQLLPATVKWNSNCHVFQFQKMKKMALSYSTFINAEIFLAEIEHHIFVFWAALTPAGHQLKRLYWELRRNGQGQLEFHFTAAGRHERRLREMAAESNTHMEFQESVLPKTQKYSVQSHCAKVQKYEQSKIGLQFFDMWC